MADLTGRGPLGSKPPKKPAKARKPMPPVSPRRKARKATEKAAGAWEHMAAVKALPCMCCGAPPPSDAHHVCDDKQPRIDWRVIPLCYACHRGPEGYHAAKASWRARYGRDCDMLERVARLIASSASE